MSEIAKDLNDSAIKIAGRALEALARGDKAGAKFLADNALLARALAKSLQKPERK